VSAGTRVAILGGGAGALAAAFELTATEELRSRHEVTVYQLGWRLGGKGASGRNLDEHARIEEHGLHLWFGFYDNAFSVMNQVYGELGRRPGVDPLATVEEAFHPCDTVVLYEHWRERWVGRTFTFPENDAVPGEPGPQPTLWAVVEDVLGWLRARWEIVRPLVPLRAEDVAKVDFLETAHVLARARRDRDVEAPVLAEVEHLVTDFSDWLFDEVIEEGLASDDDDLRYFAMALDTFSATLRGIVHDKLLEKGLGAANGEDWRGWMARHGAHEETLDDAPWIRGFYDLIFGFEDGDWTRPNVAAGAALSALFRIPFDYKKAILFKMQAGMGDVVFAPLYEVLRARGVRFAFFHRVTALEPAANGVSVGAIQVVPQATVTAGEFAYEPLVDVHGLPCWPSAPDLSQLEEGDLLAGINLEQVPNPLGHAPVTLRLGEDFDEVVLGIPIGALEPICAPLTALPAGAKIAEALRHSSTVMTQAFQLWTTEAPTQSLGWPYGIDGMAASYTEPVDTYCDMTHLLPREDWPAGTAEGISYFCGVLPDDDGPTQEAADAAAREYAEDFLAEHVGVLWPDAVQASGAIRPELIVGDYFRANVQPTERYVLTPAGSVQHRLWPWDTGFRNLSVVGDWTRNNIDGGSVEGAMTSGIWAARSLLGDHRPPLGVTGWMSAKEEAGAAAERPYVEYGALANVPGPLNCEGTTLWTFFLRADEDKLTALLRRVFAEPSAGVVDVRPLSPFVMATFGVVDKIMPVLPPFDRMGSAREPQVALWIACARFKDGAPEKFHVFCPYIWLDNPISLASGREVFGWSKSFGTPGLPADGGPVVVSVDAFGMDYGKGEQPSMRRVMTIEPLSGAEEVVLEDIGSLVDLARFIGGRLIPALPPSGSIWSWLEFVADLFGDMVENRMQEIFLKQFRSISDGHKAALQQIVTTDLTLPNLRVSLLPGEYQATVTQLDSVPLTDELGIETQVPPLALKMEFDFVVHPGEVLWPAPAAGTVPPSKDGYRPARVKLQSLSETPVGVTWVVDEGMARASHALVDDDGRVWLVDPVDHPEAIERAKAQGDVAGIIQLLDRHPRDCVRLAERLGVPHYRLPEDLPGTPFEVLKVVDVPRWRERGLWWPDRHALVIAEAIGTSKLFTAGRGPAGVHLFLRGLPPRGALRDFAPEHLLVGHGPGIHGPGAATALRDALARSRRDLPAAVLNLPRALL
jgi:uncharacterized protein with NAD-binding domain and iron-sulfur cluster